MVIGIYFFCQYSWPYPHSDSISLRKKNENYYYVHCNYTLLIKIKFFHGNWKILFANIPSPLLIQIQSVSAKSSL